MRKNLLACVRWTAIVLLPVLALLLVGPHMHSADAATLATHGVRGLGFAFLVGATNTLGNYDEVFYVQEALQQLYKALGMASRVYRAVEPKEQIKGATVSFRRPATFVATDMPATQSDLPTESVNLTLNKWKGVVFGLTDKDLSLSAEQIISDHITPATVAIADAIDQSLNTLYVDIPWVVAQTATPALADIASVRKALFDNKVPLQDGKLHLEVDSTTELAYLNALAAAGQQANTQDPALRRGSLGMLYGLEVFANQNTPSHTSGVAADATGTVDGVNAVGATTILFSGVTAGITWKAGDTFSIAGDSQRYVFTADGTDADGSAASGTFAPPLKQATAGTEVITITLTGSAKSQNLAFHENAFCLGMAPLSTMGDGLGARMATKTDPITGLSLRSRIWYDGTNAKVYVGLDALWGVKTLNPNMAVRHYDV